MLRASCLLLLSSSAGGIALTGQTSKGKSGAFLAAQRNASLAERINVAFSASLAESGANSSRECADAELAVHKAEEEYLKQMRLLQDMQEDAREDRAEVEEKKLVTDSLKVKDYIFEKDKVKSIKDALKVQVKSRSNSANQTKEDCRQLLEHSKMQLGMYEAIMPETQSDVEAVQKALDHLALVQKHILDKRRCVEELGAEDTKGITKEMIADEQLEIQDDLEDEKALKSLVPKQEEKVTHASKAWDAARARWKALGKCATAAIASELQTSQQQQQQQEQQQQEQANKLMMAVRRASDAWDAAKASWKEIDH